MLEHQRRLTHSISTVSNNVDNEYYFSCADNPVFIKKPEDVSGDSGQEVVLGCLADGNPSPSYRWVRNQETTKVRLVFIIASILQPVVEISID